MSWIEVPNANATGIAGESTDSDRPGHVALSNTIRSVDRSRRKRNPPILEAVVSLGLSPGGRVLHLGCGAGDTATELSRLGLHVLRVDATADRIADAAGLRHDDGPANDRVSVAVDLVDELELDDEGYDCVVATGAVEHARWDRLLLRRLFCLLRPRGHLIVSVPNRCGLVHRVNRYPARLWKKSPGPRRYAPAEFSHLLRKIGFDLLHTKSYGWGPREIGGLTIPHQLTAAIDWGLEQVGRSGLVPFLKDGGNDYLVVAQKSSHAGVAARVDLTPTLARGIDGFADLYKSEFDRLTAWERVYGTAWASPPAETAHRALQECRSAVVLSPHPDDELIGCGGVLLELLERGAEVGVIQMTDGAGTQALRHADPHTRQTVRPAEAERVADAMGVTRLTFLNPPDGLLHESPRCVDGVAHVLDDMNPDVVFVPFINDKNPDHVAANLVLDAALAKSQGCRPLILAYEVWSLVPPHLVYPIDAFIRRKLDLLMLYPTPMKVVDYIWHCQIRDGHHSRAYLHCEGYAEAYLALDCPAFRRLVRAHRGSPPLC